MRYLVLSDIHANLQALETVLADARTRGFDLALVLGDLVGYGADPNAVVDRIRELDPAAIIRGNHDKVASGVEDAEGFNPIAREAAEWTAQALSRDNRQYLADLARGPLIVDDTMEICHGTPFDEDAYVFDELDALRALKAAERPLCLYGHTHVAFGFYRSETDFGDLPVSRDAALSLELDAQYRYLVNVGSVGQPRDGDPRAAYGIVDGDKRTVYLYRLEYPIERAQGRVREVGLPEVLAQRLKLGR